MVVMRAAAALVGVISSNVCRSVAQELECILMSATYTCVEGDVVPLYDIWHTAYDMCASRVGVGVGVSFDVAVGYGDSPSLQARNID